MRIVVIPKVSYVVIRTMNTKITNTATLFPERQQFVGEFTGKRNEQGMAEVAVKTNSCLVMKWK